MHPTYSIIIPTYKDKCSELLIPCCESIIKYTDLYNVEVIIVANGCVDQTREYITKLSGSYPQFKLLWFEDGIGYTRATNEGIRVAQGEYFILLNNDTECLDQPQSQWIDILVKPFLHDETVGITGPMKEVCPSADREFILFFCAMISRKLIDKIGMLDECFSPGYCEDVDMAARAQDGGFKVIQVPDNNNRDFYDHNKRTGQFPLWHIGNESFKNWKDGDKLIERNNNILRERYFNKSKSNMSVNIEKALKCDGFMTEKELLWLAENARDKKVIVEVGSWHGRSSRGLSDNTDGVVYAIDTFNGSLNEQSTWHQSAKMMDGDHAFYEFLQNNLDLVQTGKIIPLRMSSKNASALFKEKGILADMIFIDADHTYEGVKRDLECWIPCLRDGGLLCGHDYVANAGMQVIEAVNSSLHMVNVAPLTTIWWKVVEKKDITPPTYDCFPLNMELDLLEKRFSELWDVVDRFVIVEADKTHGGKPKPYYFKENLKRFEKYLSKVSHVTISDYPALDSWSIERHQRDCIMRALDGCKDDAAIIISGIDEIPNPDAVKNYRVSDGIMSFEMDLYYYSLNCRAKDKWTEAKILPYGLLKKLTPCGARYTKAPVIKNGGNHYSYFGGVERIKKKIEDTAHQELNQDRFKDTEHIERAISEGKDLFDRNLEFEKVGE